MKLLLSFHHGYYQLPMSLEIHRPLFYWLKGRNVVAKIAQEMNVLSNSNMCGPNITLTYAYLILLSLFLA